MKQVIIARTDLEMSDGKLAAQVAHASLSAYEKATERDRTEWKRAGQKKIVLQAAGERQLHDLADQAERARLPYAFVRDAGRTQLEPGTLTALAIGPAHDDHLDPITGGLSVY